MKAIDRLKKLIKKSTHLTVDDPRFSECNLSDYILKEIEDHFYKAPRDDRAKENAKRLAYSDIPLYIHSENVQALLLMINAPYFPIDLYGSEIEDRLSYRRISGSPLFIAFSRYLETGKRDIVDLFIEHFRSLGKSLPDTLCGEPSDSGIFSRIFRTHQNILIEMIHAISWHRHSKKAEERQRAHQAQALFLSLLENFTTAEIATMKVDGEHSLISTLLMNKLQHLYFYVVDKFPSLPYEAFRGEEGLEGGTPLHFAIAHEQLQAFEHLMGRLRTDDINLTRRIDHLTPFAFSMSVDLLHNIKSFAEVFLARLSQADLEKPMSDGKNILHACLNLRLKGKYARKNQLELFRELLKRVDPRLITDDSSGESPLAIAERWHFRENGLANLHILARMYSIGFNPITTIRPFFEAEATRLDQRFTYGGRAKAARLRHVLPTYDDFCEERLPEMYFGGYDPAMDDNHFRRYLVDRALNSREHLYAPTPIRIAALRRLPSMPFREAERASSVRNLEVFVTEATPLDDEPYTITL